MAPPTKRALTRAEIGLAQLKNCLVNLPRSLVAVLLNSQTVDQATDRPDSMLTFEMSGDSRRYC